MKQSTPPEGLWLLLGHRPTSATGKNHLYSFPHARCHHDRPGRSTEGLPRAGWAPRSLAPWSCVLIAPAGSLTGWPARPSPLSRRVVLGPLSRCRKWVHDCPCTGLGSAGAAGGGSASAWGGKGVAAQTQTQAPACLQERVGHSVDAASLRSLPSAKLRPPSHPPKEHASRWSSPARSFSLAGQRRSVSSGQLPAPVHSALTQKLVEDVGDRVIPAALEEGQASWSHGFLVFLVEIKSVEGPLGKLVATRRGAFEGGQEGARAPGPASSPTGNPKKHLRAHQA